MDLPSNPILSTCDMKLFRYGINSSVELDFAEGTTLDEIGIPRIEPLADVTAATASALAAPINYPAMAQSITPADRVVLALGRSTPHVADVIASVVATLIEVGVDPDGITVLQAPSEPGVKAGDPCRLLQSAVRSRITRVTHDPADRRQLAYLAASKSGEAIFVNRALHEADVVLPIGCLRADDAAGYFGIHSSVYPVFSDTKTLQKFRGFATLEESGSRRHELCDDVDYAAWLLGVNFTIQLVPASGGCVLEVLAGECEAVRQRGRELFHSTWSCTASNGASLVVAAIEGDADQQTWENVGRAIHAASCFADEDGAIAICSDLTATPGPAMQRMACSSARSSTLRHIGKDRPFDALPAAQLAQALEQHRVYILSKLAPTTIEDLDMIPIAGPDELARLVKQHSSCTLLSNAQYVSVHA